MKVMERMRRKRQPAIPLDLKLLKLTASLKTRVTLCSQLPAGLAGWFRYSRCSYRCDFLNKLRFWMKR